MEKAYSLLLFIGLIPTLLFAGQPGCKNYLFLKRGFYIHDYKICQASLNQCPISAGGTDTECVNAIIKNNRACKQLGKLASVLESSPMLITAQAAGRFAIIDRQVTETNEHNFYLISTKGCLIETTIDPRTMDNMLQRKFHDRTFMIMNTTPPKRRVNRDGSQTFSTVLKITDSCPECEIIGWAKIRFEFDKKGEWLQTALDKFETEHAEG